jgi:hypothetical protein
MPLRDVMFDDLPGAWEKWQGIVARIHQAQAMGDGATIEKLLVEWREYVLERVALELGPPSLAPLE